MKHYVLKLLLMLCAFVGVITASTGQEYKRPKLKTNARDTIVYHVTFDTPDGLGEQTMTVKKLGRDLLYNSEAIGSDGMVLPQFPGGDEAFEQFLKENLRPIEKDIYGWVIVQFIVEYSGRLSHITILRTLSDAATKETLRVLKLKRWIPGIVDNKFVRTKMAVRIPFQPKY